MNNNATRARRALPVLTGALVALAASACHNEWAPEPNFADSGARVEPAYTVILAGSQMMIFYAYRADYDTSYPIGLNGNVNYDKPTLVADEEKRGHSSFTTK